MSKKISDLTSATTPLAGTETVEIVQGGVSKKVAASYLAGATGGREILSADRTYYVRTDGSDSNDGLTNTSGGAFMTIQKAVDTVYLIDIGTNNVTIQIGDGTYTTGASLNGPFLGSGTVTIQGNSGTPANVLLNTGTGNGVSAINGAVVTAKDFKTTTTTGYGIFSSKKGHINFSNINFGTATNFQIRVDDLGTVTATGNYTISAGCYAHISASAGVVRVQSKTITISGTPAFSGSYIDVGYNGTAFMNGCTFSGSATGVRYAVTTNGVCYVAGGGATYLPGGTAGTTATGGQYA